MINAGQANAATGEQGWQDALASAKAIASQLKISPDQVLLQSTGVIGQRIKMEPMLATLPLLASSLGSSHEGEPAGSRVVAQCRLCPQFS